MISERYAKQFCKDDISLIENYEQAVNDKNRKWVVHHRRGTIYSRDGLKEIGEYYKRPAIELIFMLKEEHDRFHHIGKHYSEKTKKSMSESHIGKRHSENTKKKMSESHIGKHLSEETKRKISKANSGNNHPLFGKHHTEEYRKNKSKPILQYTKEGEFIKEWIGASEVERVIGIYQGNITFCCQGKLKSAGGFVWRYK